MNYVILASSPMLLNEAFYRKLWTFSTIWLKKNEEGTVLPLIMVCGRHHAPIVALDGIDFLLFSCSTGIATHECP